MVRAGFEAEAMNHHPEWTNVYNRLVVRLSTHDAGGKVTVKDVELAKRFQKISWVG
jgi:4a-hydroxytetrahydrobiopterin dehydratase